MIEDGTIITHYKNNDEKIYGVKWTDGGLLVPLIVADDYGAYRHNTILYLKIKKDIIKQMIDDCLEEKKPRGANVKLICAEKLKNSYGWWEGNDRQLTRDEARHYFDAMIDAQAPVEAELVKHGKWIYDDEAYPGGNPYGHYNCDQCGESVPHKTNYCPNCGAKMDEVE